MTRAERLGRYRIGQRLGQGGVAEVFRAEVDGAEGFSRTFAIKCVRASVASDAGVVEGFLVEAQLAKRLSHGNIVQIHDVGVDGGLPYLVMEHVDGPSLAEILGSAGALGVADALYVIEQVCAALDYAHRLTDQHGRPAGIVHRDVHPRNILVSRDGVVKLTDFGIAKSLLAPARTVPGLIKGTLGYLSPEQVHGDDITAACDQFAAGVVLHEMLCGKNPLVGAADIAEYSRRLSEGLPRLATGAPDARGIDADLSAIVGRATAPSPGERFPAIGDLRAELERWRVNRRIRPTSDGLRRVVRSAMGAAPTAHLHALDDALADRLDATPSPHTRISHTADMAGPRRNRRLWKWVLPPVLALVAGVSTFALIGSRGRSDLSATVHVDAGAANEALGPPDSLDRTIRERTRSDANEPQQPDRPEDAGVVAVPDLEGIRVPDAAVRRPPRARARTQVKQVEPPGRLKVNVLPWARVRVGGKDVGRTPVDIPLAAGSHRVALENPETGQSTEVVIEVEPGKTVSVTRW